MGGKSKKSLGWEKKVEKVYTYKSKEKHYSYLCKYFYENEDKKRTYDTHLITTDDPEFKGDDVYIADAIAKEKDPKKIKRLTKIQTSKKEFEDEIKNKIENILKEREAEKARKAGEEADLTKLVEGKKAKKADEQELNKQLHIASQNTEVQRQIGEANRMNREEAERENLDEQTKENLESARKNTIEQAEKASKDPNRAKLNTEIEQKEKDKITNNGLFGEYKATNGETKYFYIDPYDLDAKCNPEDNNDNDFKDQITFADLNGCNIIQIGKQCYDINSFINLLNTAKTTHYGIVTNPGLGLNKDNYIDKLKTIKEIDNIYRKKYEPRDVTYSTNFITKLLEKGEDPFAPPQEE